MLNIILLSSFHKIHGKCNPVELYKIIEKIQPEVIFEELSFDTFHFVYSTGYSPNTIEAITIKNYLQQHPIKHHPVDNFPIKETDLLSDAQVIWDYSKEYRDLWSQKLSKINKHGYSFLNSNDCVNMLGKIRKIEEDVLSRINNEKLLNEHRAERQLHNKRENEMLSNIYNYSESNPYDKALFICGIEHRMPLMHKIRQYETHQRLKLNWTIYGNIDYP